MEGWRDLVFTLTGVARRHPQTAHVGLQKSLQQDWAFVQRVTPDIGMAFHVVENTLRDILLLALFQGGTSQIPRREITSLPVKQAGIALPEPTQTVGANWTVSCVIIGHLVVALHGMAEFMSVNCALLMGEGSENIFRRHMEDAETTLVEDQAAASNPDARRLGQIHQTGA